MVAYSFRKRFVGPILVGLGVPHFHDFSWPTEGPKCQTIRADRKRHARPGEELQLYCGMRTRSCFLIGRAKCVRVRSIELNLAECTVMLDREEYLNYPDQLEPFARCDGFASWAEMHAFWREEHPGVDQFVGVLIMWRPIAEQE